MAAVSYSVRLEPSTLNSAPSTQQHARHRCSWSYASVILFPVLAVVYEAAGSSRRYRLATCASERHLCTPSYRCIHTPGHRCPTVGSSPQGPQQAPRPALLHAGTFIHVHDPAALRLAMHGQYYRRILYVLRSGPPGLPITACTMPTHSRCCSGRRTANPQFRPRVLVPRSDAVHNHIHPKSLHCPGFSRSPGPLPAASATLMYPRRAAQPYVTSKVYSTAHHRRAVSSRSAPRSCAHC